MFTKPLWNAYSEAQKFPTLSQDITVDVAIVGGGITGITTALQLKEKGFSVAVIEAREVGRGTSAHSTGNLYVITDQLLSPFKSKYDQEVVNKIIRARRSAANYIEENVNRYSIDCDYLKQPMYLFEEEGVNKIKEETPIADEAGVIYSEIVRDNFPLDFTEGIRILEQAHFNPLLYIQALAREAEGGNCKIYEQTRVTKIEEEDNNNFVLSTTSGAVRAKYVVQATHTPKGVELQYHTVLGPYREYGIAVKLKSGTYPEGIFWGYYNGSKYSLRSYHRGEDSYLICVGSPHKVGQASNNQEHIEELISFVEQRFSIEEVTYKWGGQHYKPADLLPYIGRKLDGSNEFIATGYSTDGLVFGTLSALIISDVISGEKNEFEELFDASRHTPLKAAPKFLKENLNVAAQYLKDWPFKAEDAELQSMQPGEAKIIKREDKKAAVYRTEAGEFKMLSAVCTHMGCIVDWNNAEKSWDCPCHGTRFDVEGEVIEGPAFDPLEKMNQ